MSYQHVLVAVSMSPESHRLIDKAVSIVRPEQGKITLLTLSTDPEIYNYLSAPMLGNLRDVMQEETQLFLDELQKQAGYPIHQAIIASGELTQQITALCQKENIDLVICGNHNHSFVSKALCSAKRIVDGSHTDVLLVALR